jgi:hypothetical protein
MSKHLPPVPPANRSPKGTGDDAHPPLEQGHQPGRDERNYDKQGRQGNSKINTTNQGYQQDR